MSYESALRQYFAAFDGTKKDFSEVEPLFSALYHDEFTSTYKVYNEDQTKYRYTRVTRDETKEIHSEYLSKGSTVTLIHFRKIGLKCIDVEFRVENEEEDSTVRVVYSIEDGKLVRAEEVDTFASVVLASCSSDIRMFAKMWLGDRLHPVVM